MHRKIQMWRNAWLLMFIVFAGLTVFVTQSAIKRQKELRWWEERKITHIFMLRRGGNSYFVVNSRELNQNQFFYCHEELGSAKPAQVELNGPDNGILSIFCGSGERAKRLARPLEEALPSDPEKIAGQLGISLGPGDWTLNDLGTTSHPQLSDTTILDKKKQLSAVTQADGVLVFLALSSMVGLCLQARRFRSRVVYEIFGSETSNRNRTNLSLGALWWLEFMFCQLELLVRRKKFRLTSLNRPGPKPKRARQQSSNFSGNGNGSNSETGSQLERKLLDLREIYIAETTRPGDRISEQAEASYRKFEENFSLRELRIARHCISQAITEQRNYIKTSGRQNP